ncbi:MAG: fibronectin type III domain-containing protein [Acidobacteriota bacterium]
MRAKRVLVLVSVVLAAFGCGKKGPPRPPYPKIPVVAGAPRIRQAGNSIDLRIPFPLEMASGTPIKALTGVKVYRIVRPRPSSEAPLPRVTPRDFSDDLVPVASLEAGSLAGLGPGGVLPFQEPVSQVLAQAEGPVSVFYAARFRAAGHLWSPPSEPASLVPGAVVPRPGGFSAKPAPEGIRLSWTPARPAAGAAIYRTRPPAPFPFDPTAVVPPGTAGYTDRLVVDGQTYEYEIRGMVGEPPRSRFSDAAGPLRVVMKDLFAPAPPGALNALARPGGVDLFWQAGEEPDLAGYRVYRREESRHEWTLMTDHLVVTTSWTDLHALPGHRYAYAVTALDVRQPANESARSTEEWATMPLPGGPEEDSGVEP